MDMRRTGLWWSSLLVAALVLVLAAVIFWRGHLAAAPVPAGGVTVPQYFERRAALVTLLEGFAEKRDRGFLDALAPHVDRWAGEVWKSTSPLVILAEEASRLGLREFLPYLRAAAPRVPAPDDRRRVEEAVAALGP